ncbi:MAG: hypothetical protein RL325_1302 [Planctomycetota bacterium]
MHSLAFLKILRSVFARHGGLTYELARREVAERYAGSALGALWAVLTPMVTMAVYVGLFAFVFPVRLGVEGSPWEGAALILAGLVPWLAVVDVATRAPLVFVSQRSLVRQVVFPIEVLPARAVAASIVPWAVGTAVSLSVALAATGPKPTMLLLPLLWLVQAAGMLGICYLVASAGAGIRDLREIVAIVANLGLYAGPMLLLPQTIASLPGAVQWVIDLNPFSHMAWCYHDTVILGEFAHPWSWLVFPASALLALAVGAAVFARLRFALAEVL